MRDYYRILDLPHTATAGEVQHAYRRLARRHHPDRNPAPDAAERMALINEAYEWLGDADKRSIYDRRFVAAEPVELQTAVLDAVRDALKQRSPRWLASDGADAVLEAGGRRIAVRFVGLLGSAELEDWRRALDGLVRRGIVDGGVCIAYRVFLDGAALRPESSRARPFAILDLVEARVHGGADTGPDIAALLEPFLLE